MHSGKSSTPITTAALFAAVVLSQPAFAQTTAAPGETTTASGIAPTGVAPAPGILSVPMPPYARLRIDMDARDDDMLGVVKSFFAGLNANTSSLQVLRSAPAVTGTVQTPTGPVPSGQLVDLDKAAAVLLLSDADLSTILDRINHLRVVVFEPRRTNASRMGVRSLAEQQSTIRFYEQLYIEREGGRRMVRADFDDVQMMAVGFRDRGFAAVFQTPDVGIVIRADGYPNFEGVGPLVAAMMVRLAPLMR